MPLRKEEKALAKVQRKHSKLAKGTPQRRKHRKVVARVHERISFRRDNFTHQESRKIVNQFGVICVEDLSVNRMIHNHCLAKSIADASWSGFFSQLAAKAEEAGRKLVKVYPAYTSQTCIFDEVTLNNCLTPTMRKFESAGQGFQWDRSR